MNSDEIVCTCLGVTAGAIKDAVLGGAHTLDEVKEITGAGTVCGVCDSDIQNIIDDVRNG